MPKIIIGGVTLDTERWEAYERGIKKLASNPHAKLSNEEYNALYWAKYADHQFIKLDNNVVRHDVYQVMNNYILAEYFLTKENYDKVKMENLSTAVADRQSLNFTFIDVISAQSPCAPRKHVIKDRITENRHNPNFTKILENWGGHSMDIALLTFNKGEIFKLVNNIKVLVNPFSIGYHLRCLDLAEDIHGNNFKTFIESVKLPHNIPTAITNTTDLNLSNIRFKTFIRSSNDAPKGNILLVINNNGDAAWNTWEGKDHFPSMITSFEKVVLLGNSVNDLPESVIVKCINKTLSVFSSNKNVLIILNEHGAPPRAENVAHILEKVVSPNPQHTALIDNSCYGAALHISKSILDANGVPKFTICTSSKINSVAYGSFSQKHKVLYEDMKAHPTKFMENIVHYCLGYREYSPNENPVRFTGYLPNGVVIKNTPIMALAQKYYPTMPHDPRYLKLTLRPGVVSDDSNDSYNDRNNDAQLTKQVNALVKDSEKMHDNVNSLNIEQKLYILNKIWHKEDADSILCKQLIKEQGFDANYKADGENTLLDISLRSGDVELFKLLNLNLHDQKTMQLVLDSGNSEIIELICNNTDYIVQLTPEEIKNLHDKEGNSLINLVCKYGNKELVEKLIINNPELFNDLNNSYEKIITALQENAHLSSDEISYVINIINKYGYESGNKEDISLQFSIPDTIDKHVSTEDTIQINADNDLIILGDNPCIISYGI